MLDKKLKSKVGLDRTLKTFITSQFPFRPLCVYLLHLKKPTHNKVCDCSVTK